MARSRSDLSWKARAGIAALSSFAGLLFALSPWGETAHLFAYDLLLKARGSLPPSKDIVIVGIDDTSFAEINRQWPWPRSLHARLLDSLFAAGAKAVAFDVFFAEAGDPEEDRALADAIDRHKNVVLVSEISGASDLSADPSKDGQVYIRADGFTITDPIPIRDLLSGTPYIGYDKLYGDPDGFVRRVLLAFEDEKAFSYEAAKLYSPERTPPLDPNLPNVRWINFRGPAATFVTVPYWRALDPAQFLPPEIFKDKLVLVGLDVLSKASLDSLMADHFATPFSRWGARTREDTSGAVDNRLLRARHMAGVEIHANIAQSLLDDSFIAAFPDVVPLTAGTVLALLSGMVFLAVHPWVGVLSFALIVAAVCGTSYLLLAHSLTFLSPLYLLAPASAAFLVSPFVRWWLASRQKDYIRKAFSTYLAPALVEELIEKRDRLELGGEEQEGTVLFLDLANFTTLSERLSPKELITFVNKNLGSLGQIILRHEGMIDKYIGDCIMAVWGIPMHRENHPKSACAALLEIRSEAERLSAEEQASSGFPLSIRAGAASGTVVAGNIGGKGQFNYTVLGNIVNLASRLEGVNKYFGTTVIVSDVVYRAAQDEFDFRELDVLRVKGQDTPVAIYELAGRRGGLSAAQRELNAIYADALSRYRSRAWSDAIGGFELALARESNDGPSRLMLSRCRHFLVDPPPDSWDGVYSMSEK